MLKINIRALTEAYFIHDYIDDTRLSSGICAKKIGTHSESCMFFLEIIKNIINVCLELYLLCIKVDNKVLLTP